MKIDKKSLSYKIWKMWNGESESTNICMFFWCNILTIIIPTLLIFFYALWWKFNSPDAIGVHISLLIVAVVVTTVFFGGKYIVQFTKYGYHSFVGEYIRSRKKKFCVKIDFK